MLLDLFLTLSIQLHSYVLEDNTEPFLVYGNSGCGKTAVLAKLADQV